MIQEPIIFLDIDGVLNSELWYISDLCQSMPSRSSIDDFDDDFDPKAISLINGLIKGTKAKVVISSTWRKGRTVEELQKLLNEVGFIGEVIGKTPCIDNDSNSSTPRGVEIQQYLKDEGYPWYFSKYVIIDDDSDFLISQQKNFFHCDNYTGLTPNVAYKIEHFLKSFELNNESESV